MLTLWSRVLHVCKCLSLENKMLDVKPTATILHLILREETSNASLTGSKSHCFQKLEMNNPWNYWVSFHQQQLSVVPSYRPDSSHSPLIWLDKLKEFGSVWGQSWLVGAMQTSGGSRRVQLTHTLTNQQPENQADVMVDHLDQAEHQTCGSERADFRVTQGSHSTEPQGNMYLRRGGLFCYGGGGWEEGVLH